MTVSDYKPGDEFRPEASRLNAWNAAARAHEAGSANAIPEGSSGQWIALGRNTGDSAIDRSDAASSTRNQSIHPRGDPHRRGDPRDLGCGQEQG